MRLTLGGWPKLPKEIGEGDFPEASEKFKKKRKGTARRRNLKEKTRRQQTRTGCKGHE